VLAATNKDLDNAVQRGEFRKDLFYRLSAVKMNIPPLRERRKDIRLLAEQFAADICRENEIDCHGFSEEAFHYLENQSWPGNIRELKNILERILILEKGRKIDTDILEKHMTSSESQSSLLPIPLYKSPEQAERELIYRTLLDIRMSIDEIRTILIDKSRHTTPFGPIQQPIHAEVSEEEENLSLKDLERDHIFRALNRYDGNRKYAAKALGIGERTLYRKLKEYGIE